MSVFYVPAEPRPLCLALSDDRTLPLQCRFKLDHDGEHDWQIERSGVTEYRAQLLRDEQDSPSGMLPRRTPGVALGDSDEAWETSDGTAMESVLGVALRDAGAGSGSVDAGDAAGPLEGESDREVLETWTA